MSDPAGLVLPAQLLDDPVQIGTADKPTDGLVNHV